MPMLQFTIPEPSSPDMLQRFLYRLIAILYISFVFLTSALFFLTALGIWLVTYPFDRRLWLLHRFTCYCGRAGWEQKSLGC